MAVWTLAKKELRLLVRDPRSVGILVGLPLVLILILGIALGGLFEKPDDRLRVSLVDLDEGYTDPVSACREAAGWFAVSPGPGGVLAALTLASANSLTRFPQGKWSEVVRRDLEETASIRVEVLSLGEARQLIGSSKRPAVLVFGPRFSERVTRCSFLARDDGQGGGPGLINPFYRDGVKLKEIDAELLRDETQLAAAAIIEQVAQVTMLRVILPWMIGRAFEKLGEPAFIDRLGDTVHVPILGVSVKLNSVLKTAEQKQAVGSGVPRALREHFPKFELTGKTWAALTRSPPPPGGAPPSPEPPPGLLQRGTVRYQVLVPSYTVGFAFFLVLTMGWMFVSERRQGTLKRLRAAPLTRTEVLLGKLLPCFLISLAQGIFLMAAGKLVFGLRWGPEAWPVWRQVAWLLAVVCCTSLAAVGMSLLVAALAKTEMQVAVYGLVALVLALASGCLVPRDFMPEWTKQLSLVTPHAWALDAYAQLLLSSSPNLGLVATACAVLAAFGVGFTVVAWWRLRLE